MQFIICRWSSIQPGKRLADLRGIVCLAVGVQAFDHGLRPLCHEIAVQHEQLLQRHSGDTAAVTGDVWIRKIEQPQQVIQFMPADGAV